MGGVGGAVDDWDGSGRACEAQSGGRHRGGGRGAAHPLGVVAGRGWALEAAVLLLPLSADLEYTQGGGV